MELNKGEGNSDNERMQRPLTLNYSDMYPNDEDEVNYMYTDIAYNPDDWAGCEVHFAEETKCPTHSSSRQNCPKTTETELS